jgi:multiple sugar transport system substrate-binding protein
MRSLTTRRQFLVNSGKFTIGTSALGSVLAACGGGSNGTGPSSLTLDYWALGYVPRGGNPTGKLTDAAVAAFGRAHKNLKVSVTGYTGDVPSFTKLTQAVEAGSGINAFRVPSDNLSILTQQNLAAPIDDFLTADDKADMYPDLLAAVATNGKHYAWPLWVPPIGMYLNLDIFKERNVDPPADDWTYEQFVEIAQKLTFKRANGQQVYGFTGIIDPFTVNTWPIIMSDGALPVTEESGKWSYTFNTAQGISGLQKLVDLAQKYKVTPPDFGSQTAPDIDAGFGQRKVYAMYCSYSGDSTIYKAQNMNFTVKAMPVGGSGKHITSGGIGLIAVAQNQDADHLNASMALARYLTSTQVEQDVPGYYLAPGARKSVQVNAPISLFSPLVASIWLPPDIAGWPQIRSILHPNLQKAVLGQLSASDALNRPADQINGLLSGKE